MPPMKAIVYKNYGPPEVLHLGEVPKPKIKDNEILLKVHAAEATKGDCEMRSFDFKVKWFWLPLRIWLGAFKPRNPVLGGYFAGEVEAIGKKVTRFKPGDHIFGATKMLLGAYAQYMALPEDYTLALKPPGISFEEAAAVPIGGLNALHFMRKANIKPREKVLINGAGGSIGVYGVQIAKAMGAEVTAVDSPIKGDMLRQIGADHFVDYTKEDFTQNGQTYDVIFNMVAGVSYDACIKSLKPGGRYILGNPHLSDMIRSAATSRFSDKYATFAFAGEKQEELDTLKGMIEEGTLQPVVDKVFPMDQAAQAHHRVETEARRGPVVISMDK